MCTFNGKYLYLLSIADEVNENGFFEFGLSCGVPFMYDRRSGSSYLIGKNGSYLLAAEACACHRKGLVCSLALLHSDESLENRVERVLIVVTPQTGSSRRGVLKVKTFVRVKYAEFKKLWL